MKCLVCHYNERGYPIVEVGSVGDEPHFCPIHQPRTTVTITWGADQPDLARAASLAPRITAPNRKGGSW